MADIKKALVLKKHTNPAIKVLVEYYCGGVDWTTPSVLAFSYIYCLRLPSFFSLTFTLPLSYLTSYLTDLLEYILFFPSY